MWPGKLHWEWNVSRRMWVWFLRKRFTRYILSLSWCWQFQTVTTPSLGLGVSHCPGPIAQVGSGLLLFKLIGFSWSLFLQHKPPALSWMITTENILSDGLEHKPSLWSRLEREMERKGELELEAKPRCAQFTIQSWEWQRCKNGVVPSTTVTLGRTRRAFDLHTVARELMHGESEWCVEQTNVF